MSKHSRRSFLVRTAALVPVARLGFGDPLKASNLGVQLYTVRNVIDKDPAATLRAIQEIGYQELEATYDKLDEIWPALKQTTLKPVSLHINKNLYTADESQFDASKLDQVKQQGFEYMVVPSLQLAEGGADGVKRTAEKMNRLGEQAKSKGMKLCYHNHAHDFQPVDGTPALRMLLEETEKDLVFLEMDIFWVSVAGHDPVAALKAHSGRVPLLHLKDKAAGVPVQFNEKVPKDAFKEVGSGSIDIPAVLKAADAAGVRSYFVEQDQTPGDPIASLRKSYQFLSSHFEG
jgi:sugar phosphate isomerase/epimerase